MRRIQEAVSAIKFVGNNRGEIPDIEIAKSEQYIDTGIIDLIEHNINRTFLDYMRKNYKVVLKSTIKDVVHNQELRDSLEYDLRRRQNRELIINSSLYLFATENLPKLKSLYAVKGDLDFYDLNDLCTLNSCIRKIIQCKVKSL